MSSISQKLPWDQMNPILAAILNPFLAKPQNNSVLLKDIRLATGANIINHGLGRMQQGWIITDLNAAITVYRSSPFTNTTLTLTASGAATVNIEVF